MYLNMKSDPTNGIMGTCSHVHISEFYPAMGTCSHVHMFT